MPTGDDLTVLAGQHPEGIRHPLLSITPQVLTAALTHLRTASFEQGGLLVGSAWSAPGGPPEQPARIRVLAAVPAREQVGDAVSLRMAGTVWSDANSLLDRLRARQPEARIVGWYHSHPDLGAFFSATDRRTHRAFFMHSYSVGWVIDPVRAEHAAFLGKNCQMICVHLEA
ncbi:MAG: Mov34/MPN/PAD-1 family protein [Burkholderiaceae bacterium]